MRSNGFSARKAKGGKKKGSGFENLGRDTRNWKRKRPEGKGEGNMIRSGGDFREKKHREDEHNVGPE